MEFKNLNNLLEYIKRDKYSTTDNKWNKEDHPRGQPNNKGQFVEKEKKDQRGAIIEQVSHVTNISDIEFEQPTRSFLLPPLNKSFSEAIKKENKKVLLSKHTIERMAKEHAEMKDGANRKRILNNALNNFTELLYCRPNKKPNYYTVVKRGNYFDISVIDTDKNKEYFEIVDWREIDNNSYNDMIRKMEREDGQILITDGRTSTGQLSFLLFRSNN